MNLDAMQAALRELGMDGWLFYDHHHRDLIGERILGLDPAALVTRRWCYYLPAEGEPRKLAHRIEPGRLDALPGAKTLYSSWRELAAGLEAMLSGAVTVAMQYSPNCDILSISMADAGSVEFVRGLGKRVVSSADLVSRFEAVLTDEQRASHAEAQKKLDAIVEDGWRFVASRTRKTALSQHQGLNEYEFACWLREAMAREQLLWESGPDVSVNANSSDSHYEPTAAASATIRKGDFLLVDIWARMNRPDTVFYDITWTGVVDREPSDRELEVFDTVIEARDAAIAKVQAAFAAGRPIRGFEADDVARRVIKNAGFGEFFTHRTGHNIGRQLHGAGANLDNLETHDERLLLPHTCFSVEPGIYLPQFGVRSEVNMMTAPGRAWVTGRIQRDLVRI